MRRRHDTEVSFDGLTRSNWDDFAVLQRSQKFYLRWPWDIAYFIQEKCSAVGLSQQPGAIVFCSSKCTANMSKQFAFGQHRTEGRDIHGDERSIGTVAVLMNRPRRKLFASATFAIE